MFTYVTLVAASFVDADDVDVAVNRTLCSYSFLCCVYLSFHDHTTLFLHTNYKHRIELNKNGMAQKF